MSVRDCIQKPADKIVPMAAAAPEKIVITPQMIEAGMREYASRWLGLRDADDDVAREMMAAAFRVMLLVQSRSDRSTVRSEHSAE
jgi:hypothetical protein